MRSGVNPLKRYSQNFLVDPNLGRKIIDTMEIKPDEMIVEIGPGEGMLTQYLIQSEAGCVTAIEVDERLISHLQTRYKNESRLRLVHQDFLKTEISQLADKNQKIRCVGNLPYGVTSPILFHLLENRKHIHDLTVMVQKEVGERLAAKPNTKTYGIPSVLFQAVSDINLLFSVSHKAFRPVPQVESAVLHIVFHVSPR
jgi:16S rRNA (adenine1518-N6/adenine1519-N6)-dimethyltransferase